MAVTINGTTGISTPGLSSTADVTLAGSGVELLNNSGRIVVGQTGSVIQVVSTTKTDTTSGTNLMSSGSWANVLQASITPSSSSSKILIFYSISFSCSNANGDASVPARLVRGSTAICVGDAAGSRNQVTNGNQWASGRSDMYGIHSQNFLDSPATTSSTTYSVQLAGRGTGTGTWYCNRSYDDANSTEGSRSTSTITLMEIAQ